MHLPGYWLLLEGASVGTNQQPLRPRWGEAFPCDGPVSLELPSEGGLLCPLMACLLQGFQIAKSLIKCAFEDLPFCSLLHKSCCTVLLSVATEHWYSFNALWLGIWIFFLKKMLCLNWAVPNHLERGWNVPNKIEYWQIYAQLKFYIKVWPFQQTPAVPAFGLGCLFMK